MAYFAKLDENNIVVQVISVSNAEILDADGNESEQVGIEWCRKWSGGHAKWIQTSFNRRIRKNFAALGNKYDKERDAFIPVQPFESWKLNEETCNWESPIPYPEQEKGTFYWDEGLKNWVKEVPQPPEVFIYE